MPLDNVARRYADNLYKSSLEEIVSQQQTKLIQIRDDHAHRSTIPSGPNIVAQARVLVEQVQLLGEARADSLLKAHQKAGVSFDDGAFNEIKTEVIDVCHQQQHFALSAILRTIGTVFGGQAPSGLQEAVVKQIMNGVDGIMSRLNRSLSIKRDEAILDKDDARSASRPTVNIHNSNVGNVNFGAQTGTINSQVIERVNGAPGDGRRLRMTTWEVDEVTLRADYLNAASHSVTISCRSVSEREPHYVSNRSADGHVMLSEVIPPCLLLDGVTHKYIVDLGWKPNRLFFKVLGTGELKEYGVEPYDTLEPEPQFAIVWPRVDR
jgi:hypothetical protein